MRKTACIVFVLFLLSCGDEYVYDKEVRLSFRFPYNGMEGFSTTTSVLTDNIFIRNFNKKNYPNLKSIKVSAFLMGSGDAFFVELYNDTDNVVVESSLMSTSSPEYVWINSENILNKLPNKTIDLTFSVHAGPSAGNCGIMDAELILTR